MAEALVTIVLQQLASIIKHKTAQEVKLVAGVEKDVEKLTSNFRAIQAVLADAEERQLKEAIVKHWLHKLKDISYDMDDVLDEWSTTILKSQMDGIPFPKMKVCSFICSLPCFHASEVRLRHDIAYKIKALNGRLDDIAKEKDNYNFILEKGTKQIDHHITVSVIDVSEVKGRERDRDAIINMLLSESGEGPNLHSISIVGMGGIGKTTLAQLAYNNGKMKAHFEERIWVCVSDPFDEIRVAKAILESLSSCHPDLVELESLLQQIRQFIGGKKFLLVLDDVWEEDSRKWKQLNDTLKCGSPGSKILVTTRKENVANMMGCTDTVRLRELPTYECWSLFSWVAFSGRSDRDRENLEDIGRKIVEKCKGLPLAVKTLASLLRFKRSREEWQRILDSNIWELKEAGKVLLAPLWLSYYDLPSEMRCCFSYCAIFPKDYMLERRKLIDLWMAQGYLGSVQAEEMEIAGQSCFENLAARSFFQDFHRDSNSSIVNCKMHDLVHDFAKVIAKNECVGIEVGSPEEEMMESFGREARHLMIVFSKEAPFPVSYDSVKKLRSLIVEFGSNSTSAADLPNLFSQLTCLRALKLSNFSITEVASEVGKLMHLRYLDLSNNCRLKKLPETICKLYNLQTLVLNNCVNLEKLPCGIGTLVKLMNLKNYGTKKLTFMPKGIERLTSLRSLDEFVVSSGRHDSEASTLGDLRNFNQIRKTLQIRGLGNVKDVDEAKKACLKNKKYLSTLILRFDRTEAEGMRVYDNEVIEALEPPQNLECLDIHDYRGSYLFPKWMMSLTLLWKVSLSNIMNYENLLHLWKLPSLEYLELRSIKGVKKVSDEFLGIEMAGIPKKDKGETSSSSPSFHIAFPKLKEIKFFDMEEWEAWDIGTSWRTEEEDITPKILPSLCSLEIERCPKLKVLPNHFLLSSRKLKKVRICECPILRDLHCLWQCISWEKICHIQAIELDKANRRKLSGSLTIDAPAPFDDGYAWRKYGQKEFLDAQYPRNHFRCTYGVYGCVAIKHVQRIEKHPPKIRIKYYGQHTCKSLRESEQSQSSASHRVIKNLQARLKHLAVSFQEPSLASLADRDYEEAVSV